MQGITTSQRALKQVMGSITLPKLTKKDEKELYGRLELHFPALFEHYYALYGSRYDFFLYLQKLVSMLCAGFASRSRKLKTKDAIRLKTPNWFRDENVLGMAVYVDLFAGDFKKLKEKIPYFEQLGINYVHLMPLYLAPEGNSDGGYAVSDYRKVDPRLGTEKELKSLATAFNEAGIALVLDFVFNHTSDEHAWAKHARSGDEQYQEFYYFFDDKREVDEYNATCREIFPSVRRGSFTWLEDVEKWVWTTFNSFQWDLNYSNPAVFNAITDEMLFLANLGCDGLRLDALAFIWKEKGTQCESLPKAHTLIQAFNLCLQITAPAVLFKSEAIVHPDEVAQYIDKDECQLSYNPLMMALMWESLATRETKLLTASLKKSFAISPDCSWVNYIRCHDDIGWTFDDAVADQVGIKGHDHRQFLNQFYTGKFEGAFANGVPFQENPETGDCRVCGSLASLCGLEAAMQSGHQQDIELAVKRVRLLNSINLSIGGVPLIYQGDELGMFNDYQYLNDPHKVGDTRWVNRPAISEKDIAIARDQCDPRGRIHQHLVDMIHLRQSLPVLGVAETEVLETYRPHLFAYVRKAANGDRLLAICNFSEHRQTIPTSICDVLGSREVEDVLNVERKPYHQNIIFDAYDIKWLKVVEN
ncbi:alpha-amylase family protein [Vibrio barjaei]|uniref:alpha-amylase family protein n=1 Tax=Vibrio barjaei TaxID=1676683 RepID=UPI002284C085|nr:alpha-amylase family protein [Vibrio barjaei]MCY9873039.1 alpha-amylase family protein [Vibrio barjaei]